MRDAPSKNLILTYMALLVIILDNEFELVAVMAYPTAQAFSDHFRAYTGVPPPVRNKHMRFYKISKETYKKFRYVKNTIKR